MDYGQMKATIEERRKRVNRMKKYMFAVLLVLLLIPAACCMVLFYRMHEMQQQINTLIKMHEQGYSQAVPKPENDDSVAKAAGVEEDESGQTESIVDEEVAGSAKQDEGNIPDDELTGKKVYLTFDDGPSENTDKILEILDEYNVKATFFVIGREDEASKERYKKIYDNGHTLGMHSYSHKYSKLYQSKTSFKNDLNRIQNLLFDVTGEKPNVYRFPGGSSNTVSNLDMKEFIKILNEKKIDYYDWNVINGDATGKKMTKKQMIQSVITGVESWENSVVLMHDCSGKEMTVEILPTIIKKLQKMDANILPITESTYKVQHVKADSVKSTKKNQKSN